MKNNFKIFLILGIICLIYLFTRIYNLTSLPVFGDEAIYVRWSQIIKSVDTLRFIPLTDGKEPLFMWLTALNLKFFTPLIAGRLISVFAGLGTIIVLYLLTSSYLPSLIYIFLRFVFFFDRLALEFKPLAEQKGLSFRVLPTRVRLRSDPALIERILHNLLSNAIGCTRTGGVVVGCRRRSAELHIEIWDSGPGIALFDQPEIFREFPKLKEAPPKEQQGTGLGLAIVARLVRLLGLRIKLRSALGKGSMFAVILPSATQSIIEMERLRRQETHLGKIWMAGIQNIVMLS